MRINAAILALALLGCTQKMALHQAVSVRVPPEGTIAQNQITPLRPDAPTLASVRRGRERFDIYCAPCHGFSGYGDGVIVQRGFLQPPSYHIDRLRRATDQHFYEVITNGSGAMYSYADRLDPADRWSVVSYIRALQLSQDPGQAKGGQP